MATQQLTDVSMSGVVIRADDVLPADPSHADLRTAEHCPTHRRKKNKSKVIRNSEANTLDVSKGRRSQFVVFVAQRYLFVLVVSLKANLKCIFLDYLA